MGCAPSVKSCQKKHTTLGVNDFAAMRGLIMCARRAANKGVGGPAYWPANHPYSHRVLLQYNHQLPGPGPRPKKGGFCKWCQRYVGGKKMKKTWRVGAGRRYHKRCYKQYALARGAARDVYHNLVIPLPRPPICDDCGAAFNRSDRRPELDHLLALKVAQLTGRREYIRAFLPSNLRWICRPCHLVKTRCDVAEVARLRRETSPGFAAQKSIFSGA